jgi:hypothetical protein
MRPRQIGVIWWTVLLGFSAMVSLGAGAPRRDVKNPAQWWTRATTPDVALFDSLDRVAWPAAKACYDSTVVGDPAWKRHYNHKPAPLERRTFPSGPTIRHWEQQWIVLYGGASSGPGVEVVIGPDGKAASARASFSMK